MEVQLTPEEIELWRAQQAASERLDAARAADAAVRKAHVDELNAAETVFVQATEAINAKWAAQLEAARVELAEAEAAVRIEVL